MKAHAKWSLGGQQEVVLEIAVVLMLVSRLRAAGSCRREGRRPGGADRQIELKEFVLGPRMRSRMFVCNIRISADSRGEPGWLSLLPLVGTIGSAWCHG